MTNLKPCPFCGSAECEIFSRTSIEGRVLYDVVCHECGTLSGPWGSAERCAKHWNRRASLWQPIETAPKREYVLIPYGESIIIAGLFESHGGSEHWYAPHSGSPLLGRLPTHWMPLPEPLEGKG